MCMYCTHVGHSVDQCDTKRQAALMQSDHANIAVESLLPPNEMLLIGNAHAVPNKQGTWYLNSGASAHMTCQWEWLESFSP